MVPRYWPAGGGRAALRWGCCAPGMLWSHWPGGQSLQGKEGAPIPCESLVPRYLNWQVPQMGVMHPQRLRGAGPAPCTFDACSSGPSWRAATFCQDAVDRVWWALVRIWCQVRTGSGAAPGSGSPAHRPLHSQSFPCAEFQLWLSFSPLLLLDPPPFPPMHPLAQEAFFFFCY